MKFTNHPALITGCEDIVSKKSGEKYLKLYVLVGKDVLESLAPRGFEGLNGHRAGLEASPPKYVPATVTGGFRASRQATGYYEPYFESIKLDAASPAPTGTASK